MDYFMISYYAQKAHISLQTHVQLHLQTSTSVISDNKKVILQFSLTQNSALSQSL